MLIVVALLLLKASSRTSWTRNLTKKPVNLLQALARRQKPRRKSAF